jgi:PAS domain S-box-containing protein
VQDVTERTWTERLLGAEKRSVALLSAPTSPEEPVGPLLAILGDALGYARVEFWQLRTGDHQPVRTQHWSRTEPAPTAVQGTRTTDSRLARAFSAQKPVIEPDEIVIPVTAGGQTAGVLVLAEPTGDGAPSGSGLETFTQTLAATLGHYLDRQSTEAALRTSEARLHAFLTYLPHPAWVKDQSGRYLIINPAFHAKFLPSGAEALGRTDSQLFPPTVSDLLRRNDRAVFESGRPLPGVMEVPTPHGPRTYMTVKFPFPSPDGQRTVGGVAVDVTDRIAAERQAIAATRLMRTIIDSTAGPISARDRHLRYLLMNRYQAEFLGTTPDSVVGQSVAELLGPEAARRTAARDLEAMTTGHPLTYEETVTDSHGATRTWLTTTTPLPGGPGEPDVVGAVSVSVDITERKATEDALRRSEDQARTLIRAVPMIVFVCDPDARQVLVSDRWFDYTGLRDASDVRWLDLIHPEDVPAAVESWNQSAATGKPYQAEFRFRRADGVYRWHQTRALPLRDGDGTIRQWLGTSVDVDDLKATVRVMDEARAAADAANQAKTEFLANVSHELRTPLAGILGMTELMLVETLPPAQRERLSIVQSSAERLKNLVNDLLDVAKIDAGRLELVASPFDLRHTVQLALAPLELDAQRKGLAFTITIAPDIPQVVVGDAHRLTQVLTNLVDNAIKFTETGDIRVSVDCRSLTDSTAHLDFVVQDTGIGIPGDRLTAIFERFVQAAPGVSRKYGGSGLGLSIARRLVELMGGTLTAQSEPGRGSQFRFDVRLLTASHPAATRLRLSEEPTRVLGILVVDDQPINLRVVGDVLRRAGHRVVTVRDGHEAVEAARRERFDIILMDIQMPELDGFRTTALIRRQEQDTGTNRVPIIALTARAMPGERAECLRAGMDGFISKPIDWPELFRMIADLTQPIPAPGSSEEQAMTDPIRVALQRCGDDPALLAEVVDVFETDAPKFVEEIRGAVAAGNLTLAAEAAHKLVGLAGTLEAGAVVVAARAVETRARQNDLAGTAAELETLTAALADFTPRLTQYRNL